MELRDRSTWVRVPNYIFLCSQMRAASQNIPKEKLHHSVLWLPPERREGCAEAQSFQPLTLVWYSGAGLFNAGSLSRAAWKENLWKNPTANQTPVQTKGARKLFINAMEIGAICFYLHVCTLFFETRMYRAEQMYPAPKPAQKLSAICFLQ